MQLYLKKQLSETVWERLWLEWQDRRNAIRREIALLWQRYSNSFDSFEESLAIFSQLSTLYSLIPIKDDTINHR